MTGLIPLQWPSPENWRDPVTQPAAPPAQCHTQGWVACAWTFRGQWHPNPSEHFACSCSPNTHDVFTKVDVGSELTCQEPCRPSLANSKRFRLISGELPVFCRRRTGDRIFKLNYVRDRVGWLLLVISPSPNRVIGTQLSEYPVPPRSCT